MPFGHGWLPTEAQSRWYHRKPPPDETQQEKSLSLLDWLEEEWKAAVTLHLDIIARQPVTPANVKPRSKSDIGPATHTSMDQGLMVGTHLAQQGQGGGDKTAYVKQAQSGPVLSSEMADKVTAKQTARILEKKLDACPLCPCVKPQHFYEKTWPKVVPAKKTQMVSTHLSSVCGLSVCRALND